YPKENSSCTGENLTIVIVLVFQVGEPEVRQYKTMPDSQQMSYLSLSTTLFPIHYTNGQLILKCTAHVTTLYRQTTEVHLSSRAREPVPERDPRPHRWFEWVGTPPTRGRS
ncbi:hypothetical protein C0J52_23878, partial [Blattella germanica]